MSMCTTHFDYFQRVSLISAGLAGTLGAETAAEFHDAAMSIALPLIKHHGKKSLWSIYQNFLR